MLRITTHLKKNPTLFTQSGETLFAKPIEELKTKPIEESKTKSVEESKTKPIKESKTNSSEIKKETKAEQKINENYDFSEICNAHIPTLEEIKKYESIKNEAERNGAEAQFLMGWYFENGFGIIKNESEYQYQLDEAHSAQWYQIAADQGHIDACVGLGRFYFYCAKDVKKAEQYLTIARGHDSPQGLYAKSLCLYHGLGLKVNNEEADKLLKQAAKAGYVRAQSLYGTELKDENLKIEWLQKAAEQNYRSAIRKLALLYYKNGSDKIKDLEKAMHYFKLAYVPGCKLSTPIINDKMWDIANQRLGEGWAELILQREITIDLDESKIVNYSTIDNGDSDNEIDSDDNYDDCPPKLEGSKIIQPELRRGSNIILPESTIDVNTGESYTNTANFPNKVNGHKVQDYAIIKEGEWYLLYCEERIPGLETRKLTVLWDNILKTSKTLAMEHFHVVKFSTQIFAVFNDDNIRIYELELNEIAGQLKQEYRITTFFESKAETPINNVALLPNDEMLVRYSNGDLEFFNRYNKSIKKIISEDEIYDPWVGPKNPPCDFFLLAKRNQVLAIHCIVNYRLSNNKLTYAVVMDIIDLKEKCMVKRKPIHFPANEAWDMSKRYFENLKYQPMMDNETLLMVNADTDERWLVFLDLNLPPLQLRVDPKYKGELKPTANYLLENGYVVVNPGNSKVLQVFLPKYIHARLQAYARDAENQIRDSMNLSPNLVPNSIINIVTGMLSNDVIYTDQSATKYNVVAKHVKTQIKDSMSLSSNLVPNSIINIVTDMLNNDVIYTDQTAKDMSSRFSPRGKP